MTKEKIKIAVDQHRVDPTIITPDRMKSAGWSDDPGDGKAILAPDERGAPGYEVLNPLPFAPPIGWEPTPPIEQLVAQLTRQEFERLRDEDEIDDVIDAEDFDVPDELPPLETIYEVLAMTPEAPALPRDSKPDLEDKAKADVEYEEALQRERLRRKRNRAAALKRQQMDIEDLDQDPGQSDPTISDT